MATKKQREIGKLRLTALAALLRIVPDEKFCMRVFFGLKHSDDRIEPVYKNVPITKCGTVACAMGHAISAFPQLEYADTGHVRLIEDGKPEALYDNEIGAAVEFFGITRAQALRLFMPRDLETVSKETVIERIEAMANR